LFWDGRKSQIRARRRRLFRVQGSAEFLVCEPSKSCCQRRNDEN
jgi:hypothetical protein